MVRLAELVDLLERYPAPGEEAAARRDMLTLAEAAPDPFSRHDFDPGHFTASGFVLSPDRASLLMVHHRRLDRWLQPGGHIDPTGERVVEAAVREIEEETGVGAIELIGEGIFDVDVHPVPGRHDEPPHLHFDVRFLFAARSAYLAPDHEVRDAAWVRLEDVPTVSTDRSVLRAVEKLTAG